ncbi:unnamed protein product [Schistosoma guineensis]|nr:unnamed protein product [Schistosoma guineensis]
MSVDISVYNGYAHGDICHTFVAGVDSHSDYCDLEAGAQIKAAVYLCTVAQKCHDAGISVCGPNAPYTPIAEAVTKCADAFQCPFMDNRCWILEGLYNLESGSNLINFDICLSFGCFFEADMKNPIELKTKANELFKKGLYREAIGLYDECLGLYGVDKSMKLVLQRNKAQCFLNLRNFGDALTAALEALSISPGDPKALYRCAQAYEGKGMLKEALETGRRLILVDPKNKAAQNLTHKLETSVASYVAESESLTGKLNKMFDIVNDNSSSADQIEQAIVNLSILIKENPKVASSLIWTNPNLSKIYSVCRNFNHNFSHNINTRIQVHPYEKSRIARYQSY